MSHTPASHFTPIHHTGMHMHDIEDTFLAGAIAAMEFRVPAMKVALDDAADSHVFLRVGRSKENGDGASEERILFDIEYTLFKDSLQLDQLAWLNETRNNSVTSVPTLLDCGGKIAANFLEYIDLLAEKARKVFAMHFRYELRPQDDDDVSPRALREYMASVEKMADSEKELMKAALKKELTEMCAKYLPFLNFFISGGGFA